MGFLGPTIDKSGDGYDRAISNVQILGANASKSDKELCRTAAKQCGTRGEEARKALGVLEP